MDGGTIVALLPDGGWKYLSAGTFTTEPRRDGGGARGRRQLVVSERHPGPARPSLPGAIRDALVDARPGRVPERGVRPDHRRRAGGRRRPGAPLRGDAQQGRLAVPLRDRPRRPVPPDHRDRRRRRGRSGGSSIPTPTRRPCPSPTDIGLAFYPDALYVLVSLGDDEADPATGEPSVRAWRIVDGDVHEVALA